MDPASAVGVASAAITFLDFSIDVCKTFSQVLTSDEGITKHNAEVEATVKRHKEMIEALKTKGSSATSLQLGPNISSAVDESIAVSTELLVLIERLRLAKYAPVIGPLKAVYHSMRSRERVERLQRTAESCRSAITQGLIQATWETNALHHECSGKAFQSLDQQATDLLGVLRAGDGELLKQLVESRRHFDATVSDLQNSIRTGNDHITQKIDSLTQKVLDMDKPDLRKAFVDSLFFPDYERREKALSGPSPKTFEWIFNRDGVADLISWRQVRWPSFPQWLENADSNQQYWLSGKAGSGKSTLMAHIIREDMALHRTKGYLKTWHSNKPLHILKFFLFRAGRERQAGLEYLLKSLLYQLVTSVPIMQEILMANFLPPGCGVRIPTWPVQILKTMLESALDAADDCCFLIFVDGADEFEDFQHVQGREVDAADLVDFLFEIQQPNHVKLCISSRPELRITNVHPSFLEAKLADLNYDDIRRFVHEQIQAMVAISDPKYRSRLAMEITSRADGIFLWAAFAVTQMKKACRHGYGGDHSELMKTLDDMGKGLNDAISHMLRGIETSHRPALSYYLQALKSWQSCDINKPLTVGLIAASRSGEGMQTRSRFLAACRREQRDIQNFSQGIIEVRDSRFTPPEGDVVLVRSHNDHSSESDLQYGTIGFEPGEGAWITVAHSGPHIEITQFCDASVTLIHRSAYDFFFAPNGWNEAYVEQCRSLLSYNENSKVFAEMQAGLQKLFWIKPWPMNLGVEYETLAFDNQIAEFSGDMIRYSMGNPNSSLTQSDPTSYVNDLLSSMRLELLLSLNKAPIVESRKHVPGDIFSRRLYNGRLRTLGEDEFLTFESTEFNQDHVTMAKFEAHFLCNCASWEALYDYIGNRLGVTNGRASVPLVQTLMLQRIVGSNSTHPWSWWYDMGEVLLLNCLQRWTHTLAHTHRSLEFYTSVWRLIGWLVPAFIGRPSHEDIKRTRLSMADLRLTGSSRYFQWTPLASDDITNQHEEIMIKALLAHRMHFDDIPEYAEERGIFDRSVQIMEPWDVWVEVLSASGCCKNRTVLLGRMSLRSTADLKKCEHSTNRRDRYFRLVCFDELGNRGEHSKSFFSVDIDPLIEFWDTFHYADREDMDSPSQAAPSRQEPVGILIEAVRQSMELDEDQKNCMIEGIKAFKFPGSKT
jgi:hypothetical protein